MEEPIVSVSFGPLVQLVRTLPCHGRGRRFKSDTDRLKGGGMPYKDPAKQKAAQRAWYERNTALAKQRTKSRRTKRNQYKEEYKIANSVCPDCNISYPPHMLDFDHIVNDKVDTINKIVRNGTMKQLLEEIPKCEVVCSNCHRHRTYMRSLKI